MDSIQQPEAQSKLFKNFWTGAFSGLLLLIGLVSFFSGFFFETGIPKVFVGLTMLGAGLLVFWIFRILLAWFYKGVLKIPAYLFSLILATFLSILLAKQIRFWLPDIIFYPGILITMTCAMLLFGSMWVLIKGASTFIWLHRISILFSTLVLITLAYFLIQEGNDAPGFDFEPTPTSLLSSKAINNPGEKGAYSFSNFTYGSGNDRWRVEFGAGVTEKTNVVDASLLLPDWKGTAATWRKRFWGFGVAEFPLNGRVWIPEGAGKFPIVFMIHGNHGMEDFSDAGYGYLGELLASRGFIFVSVDENFLNSSWSGDFRGKEMTTRAWLLLKHIELWSKRGTDSSSLFYKANLDQIILAGHSRGGEAVPIAAHFNSLAYFPDNANVKFDFHFGIKGVIAIAPTDKRYTRRINLENINYLSLHGSYDSDEASFFGFRQYQRVKFNDSLFYFKAGVFIHRANHGQFNSGWGRLDAGPPRSWLLNIKPLISSEEQQQIAKVYISAYAEVVLHKALEYLPLFRNAYSAKDWLPNATLLNTYADSRIQLFANFEEDIDLTSASHKEVTLMGEHLKIWREEMLLFRDKDTQGNNAVVVGWNTTHDSVKQIPQYRLSFSKPVNVDSATSFFISMALGNPADLKSKDDSTKNQKQKESPINFTIQLQDSLGRKAQVELNVLKKLAPRLEIQFEKLSQLQKNYGDAWEPTFETVEIPLNSLKEAGGLKNIKHIRFLFDRDQRGVLILDDIGWQKRSF